MTGIQLNGQLGNQLFQLAFIRNIARLKKEVPVILEDKSYGCLPEKYFRLYPFEKKILRKIIKRIFLLRIRKRIVWNNLQKAEDILPRIESGVIHEGFFQSDKFFSHSFKKNPFRVRKKFLHEFYRKYDELLKSGIITVIHVRRKDYLDAGSDELGGKGLTLPLSYYKKALDYLHDSGRKKILVISDDPEYIKNNLNLGVPYTLEINSAIIDLLLMNHADNLILSNSSFSWWGAYLNKKENLKVIAPEYWLGFKVNITYPIAIFCDSWTRIRVANENDYGQ